MISPASRWALVTAVYGFIPRRVYEDEPGRDYPLLVLLDGQWMVGPVQVPFIADALIKHGRLEPVVIAMSESGGAGQRHARLR